MIKQGKAFLELEQEVHMLSKTQDSIQMDDLIKMFHDTFHSNYSKPTSGKEVAEELSDFVNGSLSYREQDFVNEVLSEHRTLQQSMFRLFVHCMDGWAEMHKSGMYDARNEATCVISSKIAKVKEDIDLPLI